MNLAARVDLRIERDIECIVGGGVEPGDVDIERRKIQRRGRIHRPVLRRELEPFEGDIGCRQHPCGG